MSIRALGFPGALIFSQQARSVLAARTRLRQDGIMCSQQMISEEHRILSYWWMLELFNPQSVPKLTSRANYAAREGGPVVAWSYWADEPARTPGTHLQPNQIERFGNAMTYLQSKGVDASAVIAISPFRDVADRLRSLQSHYPGLLAGTIHTAQGREANVVILVLGGDPNSPGAKAWAASSVNLVNVAASRAKRRLFVIGDRQEWAKHNYFRQLSAALN